MKRLCRIALATLVAPLVYVVAAQYPYTSFLFEKWPVSHALYAYIAFFLFGGISMSLLVLKGGQRLCRDSCALMFATAFSITFLMALGSLASATSFTIEGTVLVEGGRVTREGYLECAVNSLLIAALSSVVMAVFWFIAFHESVEAQ